MNILLLGLACVGFTSGFLAGSEEMIIMNDAEASYLFVTDSTGDSLELAEPACGERLGEALLHGYELIYKDKLPTVSPIRGDGTVPGVLWLTTDCTITPEEPYTLTQVYVEFGDHKGFPVLTKVLP